MSLLEQHFDVAFAAPDGIKKLRELILTLAMQGKLVPQDPNDEPASELLRSIELEKELLVKEGKIKDTKTLPPIALIDIPSRLPNLWQWTRIETICEIIVDCPHSTAKFIPDGIICIDTNSFKGGDITYHKLRYVSEETYLDRINRLSPQAGDVIFAREGSVGESVIIPTGMQCCLGQRVMLFRPTKGVLSRYLQLSISNPLFLTRLLSVYKGIGAKHVNVKDMRNALISLPPLAEQHRILAKIDQLMARCDELEKLRIDRSQRLLTVHTAALDRLLTAKDSSEFSTAWSFITQHFGELYSVKENVVELRKTILQLAVMGKLVRQDPNDEPASELLRSIELEKQRLVKEGKIKQSKPSPDINLKEVPYDLSSGWEWANLQDVLALVTDGDHQAPPKSDTGIPFLVIGNLNTGKVSLENCRFVPHDYYESLDWGRKPATNDILYTVTGSYGIPIFIDSDLEFCVQRHVAILKSAKSSPVEYLLHLLKSSYALKYATSVATGIAQKTVPLNGLRKMLIAVPPLAEQGRIVEKIDRLMGMCDRLEESISSGKSKQTDLLNALMPQL
ncbi:restriction endonuclease subunit S [Chamaesiphon sp. VAR_48_metabat_135_sub]|uniref:restriction endonuclease subunit S n=1 Tax=Chamaesiphon sp. VAR_48_metabat_135_sub TaxID=2964699 RepID=UPI00286C09FB|nr:restriction endonuclease subunit S [Chamaesiphon sp. VAR_48_metabat_135_sub]